jgi:hypothetical protein
MGRGKSQSQRKASKGKDGRRQASIYHDNMLIPIPHAVNNLDKPMYNYFQVDLIEHYGDYFDERVKKYDDKQYSESRLTRVIDKMGEGGGKAYFRKTFGVDPNNNDVVQGQLESLTKYGKRPAIPAVYDESGNIIKKAQPARPGHGVKSYESELYQVGDCIDSGYNKPTEKLIRQVIKDSIKKKTPEEAHAIAKDIRERAALWTPEEAEKCENALKAHVEGYPPLNIPPITERNPYFQYFNGKLHRAEMTPHNHLAHTVFVESNRSGIGLSISYLKALKMNLESQGIDLTVFCDKINAKRPMSNREVFNTYRAHERKLLNDICVDMKISMKDVTLEVSAAENRAKPESEQREDKDIGDFKSGMAFAPAEVVEEPLSVRKARALAELEEIERLEKIEAQTEKERIAQELAEAEAQRLAHEAAEKQRLEDERRAEEAAERETEAERALQEKLDANSQKNSKRNAAYHAVAEQRRQDVARRLAQLANPDVSQESAKQVDTPDEQPDSQITVTAFDDKHTVESVTTTVASAPANTDKPDVQVTNQGDSGNTSPEVRQVQRPAQVSTAVNAGTATAIETPKQSRYSKETPEGAAASKRIAEKVAEMEAEKEDGDRGR